MDALPEIARGRLGRVLRGKWKLEQVLGVGGMATVYRAVHRNGASVAIKMLHPELTLDRSLRDRFLREGYVANRVGHDGAVKILDDDVDDGDGAAFLVMELLEGETVEHRWKRKGERLPTSEVLSIAYHAADVLVSAHAQGIVHRDIKPENLFLAKGGALKILDFGVARLRERSQGDAHATQQGAALGTPAFMPPEQARGRWNVVDGRSDVWSLGATIFTLLSGRWVHERETAAEQVIAAATEHAPSLATVAPQIAPSVVTLADRALRFDMAERFQDMAAMRLALQEAASGPISDREHLPQASVFSALAPDGAEGVGSARPLTGAAAELMDAVGDEDTQTHVVDSPSGGVLVRSSGYEDTVNALQALKLPTLDSGPNASAAPLPNPLAAVTTARAVASTKHPRRRSSRVAVVIGMTIAIAGILIALVLVALRTGALPWPGQRDQAAVVPAQPSPAPAAVPSASATAGTGAMSVPARSP